MNRRDFIKNLGLLAPLAVLPKRTTAETPTLNETYRENAQNIQLLDMPRNKKRCFRTLAEAMKYARPGDALYVNSQGVWI